MIDDFLLETGVNSIDPEIKEPTLNPYVWHDLSVKTELQILFLYLASLLSFDVTLIPLLLDLDLLIFRSYSLMLSSINF